MEILLKRKYFKRDYTIGRLYIDGKKICDTLEPPSGGLDENSSRRKVLRMKKQMGTCCIPTGIYPVVVTKSPKFKQWLPLLLGVRGFEGVRIHAGNYPQDTEGCILPGWNTQKGMVTGSREAMRKLMTILTDVYALNKAVWIKIVKG